MLHASGDVLYYTAEQVTAARIDERQAMLGCIVTRLLADDRAAGNTAFWLARDLAGVPEQSTLHETSYDTDTSHGKLTASMTLGLVKESPRLQGFIGALKRWPPQEKVIDVGCGPFPILSLATALYHPKAEISAIEINSEAADAAAGIIDIFGLSERITVINSDISDHAIDPATTAAITETFNAGLQQEPGPKIVRLLHKNGVPIITPSTAELQLTLPSGVFSQAIDLRQDTHAMIDFNGWSFDDADCNPIKLRAEYYDDFGLVLAYGSDTISNNLNFTDRYNLLKVMRKAGEAGQLVYELGSYPLMPMVHELEPSR